MGMTNEEAIDYFKKCNETLVSVAKDENVYDYEKQVIEADCMRRTFEANEKVIQALEQQSCDDECIEKNEPIRRIEVRRNITVDGEDEDDKWIRGYNEGIDDAIACIKSVPPVTPKTKIGRWIPLEYDGYADGNPVWDKWECSKCGWEHSGDEESLTAFCPNCGTKMGEVEE